MNRINSALQAPFGKIPDGCRIIKCHNLRPATTAEGSALEPVSLPSTAYSDGWLPFAKVPLEDNLSVVVCRRGQELSIIDSDLIVSLFTLDSEPLCALPSKEKLIVMSQNSSYNLKISVDSISGSKVSRPPLPRIRMQEYSGLASDFASITLSKKYDTLTHVSPADTGKISQAVNDAYNTLDADARSLGLWWQPAMFQTVMRDKVGEIVMISPPMLATHPKGKCLSSSIELYSDDSRTTLASIINAPSWRMSIDIPDDAATSYADIATLEVVATPLLHSVDTNARCVVTMRRRADDNYFCKVKFTPPVATAKRRVVEDLVTHFDLAGRTLLTLTNPSAYAGKNIALICPNDGNPESDNATIVSALKKNPVRFSPNMTLLHAPHTFSARRVAESNGTCIWADLTSFPYEGYGVEHFAADYSSGAWHAVAKVTFADGYSVVHTSEGTDNAPITFGPMLSYPSADAVSITLTVMSGGITRSGTFQLSPDASENRAIYISPDLLPFSLPDELEAFVAPTENRPIRKMSDYIATAMTSSPLSLMTAMHYPGLRIKALVPARFGQSAWDFGRSRFYAMGQCGIHILSVTKARSSISLNLIDNRKVQDAYAAVEANDSVYAIAGGDIVKISGSRLTTIAARTSSKALAWDGSRHEIWCISDDGSNVGIICCDMSYCSYTVDLAVRAEHTVSIDGSSYVASDIQSYLVGSNSSFTLRYVEWSAEKVLDCNLRRSAQLKVDMVGDVENFDVNLRRINLNYVAPNPDLRLSLSGRIRSPIIRTFIPMLTSRFRLTLRGFVDDSFVFSSVSWT